MFGPEVKEVHNEQLHDCYRSSNNIGVIKRRMMRLAGHVACVGGSEICARFWVGNLKESGSLGNLDIAGRILK
jgi:hypothetical protein